MGESRFLLINVAVVILLLVLFLRGNKKPSPSSLRLGTTKLPPKKPTAPERNLNCLFQYNGHTWDAHEVLGVPAGAPSDSIQAGFDSAIRNSKDEQSKEFIKAAFEALKQHGQN